jgi:hypothetical protein
MCVAVATASRADAEVVPLTESDQQRLERQREWVDAFMRLHTTSASRGGLGMLHALQRVLDLEVLEPTDTEALQSLGVALGDVMARQLGLEWIVLHDELGRSKALRVPGGEILFFPVTMISKRVETGLRVNVREVFDKVAEEAGRQPPRVTTPPRAVRPLPPRPSMDDLESEGAP